MTISILIADDHTILRQGLHARLSAEPDFTIVGEAGNGLQALEMVEALRPDIAVLDLGLPELHGLEVTREICQHNTHTRVVILSMHAKEAYVLEALKNGASGYVLKEASAQELVVAIRQAYQGKRFLSPPLTERAIEAYVERAKDQDIDPYDTLTNRERQVIHLAAQGWSNTEIAERLVLSSRTVETHRSSLMHKLNLHNQTDLVRYALMKGILPMDE
jgi:two-component system, NarL family, response regulator NreC